MINAIRRLGIETITPPNKAVITNVIMNKRLALERDTFTGCAGIFPFIPSKAVNAIYAAKAAGTRQRILLMFIIVDAVVGKIAERIRYWNTLFTSEEKSVPTAAPK